MKDSYTYTDAQIDAMLRVSKEMLEDPRFQKLSEQEQEVRKGLHAKMAMHTMWPVRLIDLQIPEQTLANTFEAICRQRETFSAE